MGRFDNNGTALIHDDGQGHLPGFEPVSIVDIGSNSVRLVVYDAARRSPTPVFNEKVLCGLGRELATTGRMGSSNITHALNTLRRFQALNDQIGVGAVHAVATAAAREAKNGPDFVSRAQDMLGVKIKVLTGKREARLAAFGVMAGIPDADGLVGDLGGGSLELIQVRDGKFGKGVTLPLGALRLMDMAGNSKLRARRLIEKSLEELEVFEGLKGRNFYMVGGTWRNLAKLHMEQSNYPLPVLHQYTTTRARMRDFAGLIARQSPGSLSDLAIISQKRSETLPYGSEVLSRVLKRIAVRNVIVSAYGVREGLLYSKLKLGDRNADPLIAAARDLARLRSRSLKQSEELCAWTDRLFKTSAKQESAAERRLRHASCYMSDIGWRANQDYRGEQSLNIVANAAMGGVTHAERAFLALTVFYRYGEGKDIMMSPRLLELTDARMLERARIISAAQRLAYVLTGAMPGVLPSVKLEISGTILKLKLAPRLRNLWGGRVRRRLNDLAQSMNKKPAVWIGNKQI